MVRILVRHDSCLGGLVIDSAASGSGDPNETHKFYGNPLGVTGGSTPPYREKTRHLRKTHQIRKLGGAARELPPVYAIPTSHKTHAVYMHALRIRSAVY